MIKVGLTGGYASGKSFAAAEFERLGCHVIYADRLGHAVLEPDGDAFPPTVEAFGPEILDADGRIDRKKLAAIVFAAPELLERLNSFVHPAVFRLEEQLLAQFVAEDPRGIAMLEAAILIETGRYATLNRLILTACSTETQIARGMKRDGMTREQVLARINRQMPLAEKKRYADYLINTDGPKETTARQVASVYQDLKQLAENHA
ncbi:MAG TPA: dephospho-CoA kinase [Bryobacteraceae bacterium]|nr:dephospho-CoA kinase [Bryobacteraceae bacterium]